MSATITAFPTAAPATRTARTARTDTGRTGTPRTAAARTAPAPGRADTARTASPSSHLRITARGRVVLTVAVLLAALAMVAGFVLTGGGAVATAQSGDVHFDHVTVAAGETLWQVAEDVAPTADPRDVISDIVALNNLSSTQIMPGQSLAVPAKYSK